MSARYTSPNLSRDLAWAGLRQAEREMVWCACRCASVVGAFRLKHGCHVCREYSVEPGQSAPCLHPAHVRALRLDEALDELTRDREGGPLTKYVTLINTQLGEWRLSVRDGIVAYEKWGGTPVEAAGLVLLALLRERGGK